MINSTEGIHKVDLMNEKERQALTNRNRPILTSCSMCGCLYSCRAAGIMGFVCPKETGAMK